MEKIHRLLHIVGHFYYPVLTVFNKVGYYRIYPFAVALAATHTNDLRHLLGTEDTGSYGVVKIVVYIRNAVCKAHGGCLKRIARVAVGVVQDAHAGLISEVESPSVPLKDIDHSQRLLIVLEPALVQTIERPFACVAEGRVSQIMPKRHCLGQILV